MEIRLLTAINVTQVQSIHCKHACAMFFIPRGCWSTFIGTFRGLDFERSASQSRTTSTLVTTLVGKERFLWQETTSNSVSLFLLSPRSSRSL